ncbi:transposase [Alteromonas gracilis]|uniref:transposase n=1 Tax=Alteromonas gracilis TaxID=1479524 RepID=UPI003736A6D5
MANKKKVHAYTEEFRKEAVRRADQEGNSNQSVAAELGISAQQILQVSHCTRSWA